VDDLERKILDLIPKSMAERGIVALESLIGPVRDVLNRRRFPDRPLSDLQIEWLLRLLSSMDSDKDVDAARVGEREGRVASPLVERLAAGFNHGVGRSGHVTAPQPKAAGASLMQQVCNSVATDAIRQLGLPNTRAGVVLPLSTGMSIALVAATLRRLFGVKRIVYPRIDHKSPRRGIALAGLEVVDVPTVLVDDAVQTDISELEQALSTASDAAVLTTTTFFPPREPDPVKDVAKMCADRDVPHIINNAYGVQSVNIMSLVRSAIDAGRVDAVIQSSDKNFLSPVGGSVVVSPMEGLVHQIAETYAGRATAAPIVQTLAALLATGRLGYDHLRTEQHRNRVLLERRLVEIAEEIDQRVLQVRNPVSCAMTLDGLDAHDLGARLYNRRVTGPRAVERGEWGSCIDDYPHSYIVVNAAIGAREVDVERATTKLYKELKQRE